MARIFITGSSDGLGLMVGRYLADQSHKIVLHARNDARAADAKKALPKAEAVVVGDVATIAAAKDVAAQVNALGSFDGVIHNAGVGFREGHTVTSDGLPHVFAINTLAPYVLTALIERPKRLVYLSSGMHRAPTRISTISCGASGAGTDRRPTPKASCMTSCWLSPSRACGPMCARTR